MKITAKFSDGTVKTRDTRRAYTHAYMLTKVEKTGQTYRTFGFSSSAVLAQRAADSDRALIAKWAPGTYASVTVEIVEVSK